MTDAIRLAKAVRMEHSAMRLGHLDQRGNATAARKRIAGYRADAAVAALDADHLQMLADLEQHFNLSLTPQESATVPTITNETVRAAGKAKGLGDLVAKLEARGVKPADALAIVNAAPAAATSAPNLPTRSQESPKANSQNRPQDSDIRAGAVATARAMFGKAKQ